MGAILYPTQLRNTSEIESWSNVSNKFRASAQCIFEGQAGNDTLKWWKKGS